MSTNIYTEDDWDSEMAALYSERGGPPNCPQCGRSGFYGPREAEGSRRYRACKFCGFWQHVGQPAVTNKPTVHKCEEWPKVAGAAYIWWVQPDEEIYTCPYCGVEVDVDEALVTTPAGDSSHPWWQVPQGMTLDQAVDFWANLGLAPSDSALEPFLALAEELDIPVGIHMSGGGSRGPRFQVKLGNPLELEPVLHRHPRLRIYMMHAGMPFLAETVAIVRRYSQVYLDVARIGWTQSIPQEAFHVYLHGLIRAGLGERIIFGSDQGPCSRRPLARLGVQRSGLWPAARARALMSGKCLLMVFVPLPPAFLRSAAETHNR